MKYLLFDETEFIIWSEKYCWVCFCVVDNLDKVYKAISDYISYSSVGTDILFGKVSYPHYCDDTPSKRLDFIKQCLCKISFKAYVYIWPWEKNDIYKSEQLRKILWNCIKKYTKKWEQNFELVFEQGTISDYNHLFSIDDKVITAKIYWKDMLYSSLPDYTIAIISNFLKQCSEKTVRWTSVPFREADLNFIYRNISICYLSFSNRECNFSVNRDNYSDRKDNIRTIFS